jgi:DNA-binding protein HU-beta
MSTLNKSDLASRVAEETDLGTGDAKLAVDKAFEVIERALAAGEEISIAGFGKFSVAERAARQGRNPQTGETIQIAAATVPRFSASSALKRSVKG